MIGADNLGCLTVFLNVDMKAFVTKMHLAKGEIGGLNKAIIASSAVFKKVGKQFMIGGAIIVAGLALTVKAAADFETSMAKVNTMLNESTEHYLPSFSKEIKKMAMEYGQSTKELAQGTYDVLSAQIEASTAMGLMAVASESAAGGFTQVSTTTSAIITLMSTFGGQLRDTADAADWLAAVVERGRITMEDVATTIGQTAAMAEKARMSIEDYGAAFAMLTRGGLDAHKAQTALKGLLRSVLKVNDDATAAAKELGIEWGVSAIEAGNFEDTLQKLSKASIEQLSAISPNIRGLLGWAITAGQASKASEDLRVITNRLGLSHEKFLKAQKTLNYQMGRMKQTFIVSAQTIGKQLLPVMKSLVAKVIEVTKSINDFAEAHTILFPIIVKLVGVLGVLSLGLGGLIMVIPHLVAGIGLINVAVVALTQKLWLMNVVGGVLAKTMSYLSVVILGLTIGWAIGRFAANIFDLDKKINALWQHILKLKNKSADLEKTFKEVDYFTGELTDSFGENSEAHKIFREELDKGTDTVVAYGKALREMHDALKEPIVLTKVEEDDLWLKTAGETIVGFQEKITGFQEEMDAIGNGSADAFHKFEIGQAITELKEWISVIENTMADVKARVAEEKKQAAEAFEKSPEAASLKNVARLIKALKEADKAIAEIDKNSIEGKVKAIKEKYAVMIEAVGEFTEKGKKLRAQLQIELDEVNKKEIKAKEAAEKTKLELTKDTLEKIRDLETGGEYSGYIQLEKEIEAMEAAFVDEVIIRKYNNLMRIKLQKDLNTEIKKLAQERADIIAEEMEVQKELTDTILESIDPIGTAYKSLEEEMISVFDLVKDGWMTMTQAAEYHAIKLEEIREQQKENTNELLAYQEEAATRTYNTIADSFKTLFLDAFEGNLNTARDYFDAFASSVKKIIADMLAQMLALKLLGVGGTGGLLGGLFHQGGPIKKHMGGLIKAHQGVALTSDEVPIIAQTGEGVLSRLGMDSLGGKSELDNLNRGTAPQPKQEIHRHYYINAMDAKSFKDFLSNNRQSLEDVISDSYDENSSLRRL